MIPLLELRDQIAAEIYPAMLAQRMAMKMKVKVTPRDDGTVSMQMAQPTDSLFAEVAGECYIAADALLRARDVGRAGK